MLDEVKLLAEEIEDGENRYCTCPACGRPGKFSIMRDGETVVYHCFRPSCSLYRGGAIGSRRSASLIRIKQDEPKKVKPFSGALIPLPHEWQVYLRDTLGLTRWHTDVGRVMFAPEDDRVAYSILSPVGRRRGWVLRGYHGQPTKAITRMDVEEPLTSWYPQHPDQPSVVVVEDIPSALRAAAFRNAVALMGTHCNLETALEIAREFRHIVWALDADATAEAMNLQRRYAMHFDSSRVLVLPRDLKNMTEPELKEVIDE